MGSERERSFSSTSSHSSINLLHSVAPHPSLTWAIAFVPVLAIVGCATCAHLLGCVLAFFAYFGDVDDSTLAPLLQEEEKRQRSATAWKSLASLLRWASYLVVSVMLYMKFSGSTEVSYTFIATWAMYDLAERPLSQIAFMVTPLDMQNIVHRRSSCSLARFFICLFGECLFDLL